MKLAVPDMISNSYFPAIAAIDKLKEEVSSRRVRQVAQSKAPAMGDRGEQNAY